MKISRLGAALLFVPTIYPLLYFLAFFVAFWGERTADGLLPIFGSVEVMRRFHLAAMLVGFAVSIFYVMHAYRRAGFSSEKRLLWIVLLVLGGLFSAPVYWYLFIRKDASRDPENQPPVSSTG